jgi:hypothetical protein
MSWMSNSYSESSTNVSNFAASPIDIATTFAAVEGGNQSAQGTYIKENPYPQLQSCSTPGGTAVCAGDAALSAVQSLRSLISQGCGACIIWVFDEIGTPEDIISFSSFIGRSPMLLNGTTSTLRVAQTIGDLSTLDEKTEYSLWEPSTVTVADVFENQPALAALAVTMPISAQSNSGQQGLMIFFRPPGQVGTAGVCTTSDIICKDDNESTIFHEALHNFYGFSDQTIRHDLGLPQIKCTANISDYILKYVLGVTASPRCQ